MAKFYDVYKAVFDALKAKLESTSLKTVLLGEQLPVNAYPAAVINTDATQLSQKVINRRLVTLEFRIPVKFLILENAPTNWFTDIINPMSAIVDAVLADNTLSGKVKDCFPVVFAPSEVTFNNKTFYGGVVYFKVLAYYVTED